MPRSRKSHAQQIPVAPYDLQLISNPWDNVYWFSRMLINTDKYGGIGTNNRLMGELVSGLRAIIDNRNQFNDEKALVLVAKELIDRCLVGGRRDSKKSSQAKSFILDLSNKIDGVDDLKVFILTCERIIIPINNAITLIPSDDRIFGEAIVTSLMKSKGTSALAEIINLWDDLGVKGCLSAERIQVVKGFSEIKNYLSSGFKDDDANIILTAFCQEFERRLGQKRKGRAGRGVENVSSLIFEFFIIPTVDAPEHFTTGLEIDKWIRSKDGWIIGISCKRTLRERWKQAYTDNLDLLNRHKIKQLWHLITYDSDLSDEKLTEMGSYRAIFYLPDSSPRFASASKHPGMSGYVRPMTRFISDIMSEIGRQ